MEVSGNVDKVRVYGKNSQVLLKDDVNRSLYFTFEAKRRDLSKANHW